MVDKEQKTGYNAVSHDSGFSRARPTFAGVRLVILWRKVEGLKIQSIRIMLGKLDQGDTADFSRIKGGEAYSGRWLRSDAGNLSPFS